MARSQLPLDTLGATIRAHVAAGDKAIDKAEQHYIAAGMHLWEAKEELKLTKQMPWSAFVVGLCGLGRVRADKLIEIAEGRTTLEEIRSTNSERNREYRERQRNNPTSRDVRSEQKAQLNQRSGNYSVESGEDATNEIGDDEAANYQRELNCAIQKLKRLDRSALRQVNQYLTEVHHV